MPEKCKVEKKTFEEKELELLRDSVDKIEESTKKKVAQSPIITKIIDVLENFLRKKQLICYGGTALNNILPKKDQFYDKNTEVPDYDFYSPNALEDAKELADIYSELGYDDVEAKAGMHHGTFKVQVHFKGPQGHMFTFCSSKDGCGALNQNVRICLYCVYIISTVYYIYILCVFI